jgi:hypothetical protein
MPSHSPEAAEAKEEEAGGAFAVVAAVASLPAEGARGRGREEEEWRGETSAPARLLRRRSSIPATLGAPTLASHLLASVTTLACIRLPHASGRILAKCESREMGAEKQNSLNFNNERKE